MVQRTAARQPVDDAQAHPRHRPIDMVHLGKQALGDRGLEGEILRLFDTMSRTYYERLEASTNVEQLLQNLHTLKGAAAGVGAWGIADLARATEEEIRAGTPVNPERIDDLGIKVHECSAYIGELLEGELA